MITCYFEDNNRAFLRHVTVGALIIDGDEILLVKRAPHLSNGGKYAIPGGYLNRDETSREAMLREVMEETGYSGTIEGLFRINDRPDRPKEDKQNVDFIYLVKANKRLGPPDDEVSEVKWFPLKSLPDPEMFAFDHLDNIVLYAKHLQEPMTLPLLG